MSCAITVNWYQVLDVSSKATEEEIKKAYKKLALLHHPDKQGNTAVFAQITRAKNILLDQRARTDLDAMLAYESHSNVGFLDADDMIARLTQRQQKLQQPVASSSTDADCIVVSEKTCSKKSGFSAFKTALLQETLVQKTAPRLVVSWPCLGEKVVDIASLIESITIKYEICTIANQAIVAFDSVADADKVFQFLSENAIAYGITVQRMGN